MCYKLNLSFLFHRMLKTYTRKRNQENKIIEDVHELCRLCLARADQSVPIFGEVNSACSAIPMRIMICVGHEITQEDCLPNTICTNCHQELERYYKFRKKCENSYRRLKAHYNATKYQQKIAEPIENKINNEQNKVELQEYQINEEIAQGDDMERLVIVDVYNIEGNSEFDKPQVAMDLIAEPDVKDEEKVEETTEIQVIEQSDETSPDISTFLSAILVELGVLVRSERGLVLQDQGTSFQLETGDHDQVEFELVEEDSQEEEPVAAPVTITPKQQVPKYPKITSTYQIMESEHEELTKKKRVRKKTNNAVKKKSVSTAWCGECGRTFASVGALRRHGSVHSGARPFACARCERTFAQKAVLQRHLLVHEAIRPYACPSCPKSFTQRGALAAHSRAHAAPHARELALHTCKLCDRMFLYASGLSRHMLTHSGHVFACGTCDRIFNDKSSLLRHIRTTHGQATTSISLLAVPPQGESR